MTKIRVLQRHFARFFAKCVHISAESAICYYERQQP